MQLVDSQAAFMELFHASPFTQPSRYPRPSPTSSPFSNPLPRLPLCNNIHFPLLYFFLLFAALAPLDALMSDIQHGGDTKMKRRADPRGKPLSPILVEWGHRFRWSEEINRSKLQTTTHQERENRFSKCERVITEMRWSAAVLQSATRGRHAIWRHLFFA